MGWTFNTRTQTKQQFIDQLLADSFTGNTVILSSQLRGNCLWVLVKPLEKDPIIGLFLLQSDKGCWGYKDMAEADGPCYYSCPPRWFDRAPEPKSFNLNHLGSGRSWREHVREHHAASRKPRPKVGDQIRLDPALFGRQGGYYTVTADLGRKGLELNGYVRLIARNVKHAEISIPATA